MSGRATTGPVERAVAEQLGAAFDAAHLEVVNESSRHAVPPGSETHFKVVVVSELFAGQALLARHRAVHRVLARQLAGGVHALAVTALTPAEWAARDGVVTASPPCRGG